MNLALLGAGAFGAVIGWNVYFVNRYRKADVQLTDLASLVGIIGGGAVLALFPAGTELFGAYGMGLAIGFFLYFLMLLLFVLGSPNFSLEWFLDGRRMEPGTNVLVSEPFMGPRPMEDRVMTEDALNNEHRVEPVRVRVR